MPQVFDALRHDFNTRRRERCVRLDFPLQQGQGSVGGLEDLEQLIKGAIKASFETRAAAYEEEVRELLLLNIEGLYGVLHCSLTVVPYQGQL